MYLGPDISIMKTRAHTKINRWKVEWKPCSEGDCKWNNILREKKSEEWFQIHLEKSV